MTTITIHKKINEVVISENEIKIKFVSENDPQSCDKAPEENSNIPDEYCPHIASGWVRKLCPLPREPTLPVKIEKNIAKNIEEENPNYHVLNEESLSEKKDPEINEKSYFNSVVYKLRLLSNEKSFIKEINNLISSKIYNLLNEDRIKSLSEIDEKSDFDSVIAKLRILSNDKRFIKQIDNIISLFNHRKKIYDLDYDGFATPYNRKPYTVYTIVPYTDNI